jgi:hypothetical protein
MLKPQLTLVTLHSLGSSTCLGLLGPVDGRLESPELPRWDTKGKHLVELHERSILCLTTLSDFGEVINSRNDKVKRNDT